MKVEPWAYVMAVFFFIFFGGMFYIEVSTYYVLPASEGGPSFWESFQNVWVTSLWFYGSVLSCMYYLTLFYLKWRYRKKVENLC